MLLELEGIHKSFGSVRALKGVSFGLEAGEVHALLGENGAGKSTLIKVMTGAYRADGGGIRMMGGDLGDLNPARARELGIACVYQQPALFADLSVAENVGLRLGNGGVLSRVKWEEWRRRAGELLERVGGEISVDEEVGNLSMPEQQLVEVACALGSGARVMILDEPTASLTRKEQDLLYKVVREMRAEGMGVIYISHRLEEIFALADRVTVLRDGESVGTRDVAGLSEREMIRLMVGRDVKELYSTAEACPGDVVLESRGLGCWASGVRGVDFQVRSGEVLGLAGLVGAGRTELARILFGVTAADEGDIFVDGKRVEVRNVRDAIRSGIAYVPEDRRRHGVIAEMAISANMTMAAFRRFFPLGFLRRRRERDVAEEFKEQLGIKAAGVDAAGGTLSGGNQQKVSVARWLATRPRVLILDEPTQGVDVAAKGEIHRIIRELAREGMAVILISSDLPEVLGMSDRVAVMKEGRLVKCFEKHELAADAIMAAAMGSVEVEA